MVMLASMAPDFVSGTNSSLIVKFPLIGAPVTLDSQEFYIVQRDELWRRESSRFLFLVGDK